MWDCHLVVWHLKAWWTKVSNNIGQDEIIPTGLVFILSTNIEKVMNGLMQKSRADTNLFCCFRIWRQMLWNWNSFTEE